MISSLGKLKDMRLSYPSLLAATVLVLVPLSPPLAADAPPAAKASAMASTVRPQTKCPVMGGDIDKSLYVDACGKRIYLCCAACEDAVRTEPEKYIRKIQQRGESVTDTPPSE